jgi:hypothetical protein
MKTALALAVAAVVLVTATATTAIAASKSNTVTISYVPPKNPAHQPIYDGLKERRPLEKLQQFLAPFRLPRTLKISLAGCDGEADAFYADDAITICYEYIDELWKNMPAETAAGIAPIDTIIGPFFDTSLHEFAHALFDMFDLPLLGREEDAADRVATYIFLQLGKTEARRLITATAKAFKMEAERAAAEPPLLKQFAREHGTPAQRAYNVLCIAYGADPKLFGDFVTDGYLPKERAESCDDEYGQVLDAFEILISPHIDRALAKKVLDKSWLPERNTRVQRRPGASGTPQEKLK